MTDRAASDSRDEKEHASDRQLIANRIAFLVAKEWVRRKHVSHTAPKQTQSMPDPALKF